MPDVSACPDRGTLAQLLDGRTNDDQAGRVENHLLACESCCEALDAMGTGDTLIESVRGTSGSKLPLDADVQGMLARLKTVALPPPVFDATLAISCESTDDAWGLEGLLDPPQAEGELGWFAGYRVLRVLGAGGMGLVFDAEDPQLQRHVALKVMKPLLAAQVEQRKRFLREARAAAAIEHSHIVAVYQVGEHRNVPFLAMQLLKGESLDDRLRREGSGFRVQSSGDAKETPSVGNALCGVPIAADAALPPLLPGEGTKPVAAGLPLTECLRIGRETAEALAVAHERRLIHRDVKPANIWLESPGGWVKLLDFGLAHVAEDVHLTQTGAILGTPAYMSPEQARGEPLDARSDLFSLGAVLYKLTTGEVPFRGNSTMAVLTALVTAAPQPVGELNPEVPPALGDLIMRLLAKNADGRFESAAAVVAAIRAIEDASLKSEVQSAKSQVAGSQRSDAPARRGPRWPWLIAAAGAAALMFAGIVVVIRDQDGREVGRHIVPDDGSAIVEAHDQPVGAKKAAAALPEGGAIGLPARQAVSPPSRRAGIGATLPEPPPLEEWLKGRDLITVAQDGSGQFRSIQEALEALLPGQVIKVLDRGPYRLCLNIERLPQDVGLTSDQRAVLEISDWLPEAAGSTHLGGMHFSYAAGFRLSGFTITGQRPARGTPLLFGNCADVVIERCIIRDDGPDHGMDAGGALSFQWFEGYGKKGPVCVRDSAIDGELRIGRGHADASVTLVRNYLRRRGPPQGRLIFASGREGPLVIRDNVLDTRGMGIVCAWESEEGSPLILVNNTIFSRGNVFDGNRLPPGSLIANNLFEVGCRLTGAAVNFEEWRLGPNAYLSESTSLELPRRPNDVNAPTRFLSNDFANRGYRRLPADSPLAKAGLGGEWPDYIGALAPGPAPKEGDWFTRLQERWTKVAPALRDGGASPSPEGRPTSPPRSVGATISEPPPLEEWLKGREVLTVAQDGGAQFKTVQAALDALKPHQVVTILDRGPYRESLHGGAMPIDTGLVSQRQAAIELSSWEAAGGHHFQPVDGFRLSGLRFVAPAREQAGSIVGLSPAAGLVVDDCYFGCATPHDSEKSSINGLWITAQGASDVAAIAVRDCRFDGAALCFSSEANAQPPGAIVVERNFFYHTFACLFLRAINEAFIRQNVFDGLEKAIDVAGLREVRGVLEISNNTARVRDWGINVRESAPKRGVTIHNNISNYGVALEEKLWPMRRDILKDWQIGHNNYLRSASLPKSPGDVLEDPKFLSTELSDRDYLRISADGPLATGGAGRDWPAYIGALPPGPAPKEGDWFTRLRERWQKVAPVPARRDDGGASPSPGGRPQSPPRSVGATLGEQARADRAKPFVLVRGGKQAGEFKTMAGVLAEMQAGDEIEVFGNGPFALPIINLDGKPLTIRAGAGFRPRFVRSPKAQQQLDAAWITMLNAPIVARQPRPSGRR